MIIYHSSKNIHKIFSNNKDVLFPPTTQLSFFMTRDRKLTRDQLYKGRLYAVVVVAFLAAIVTPADPLSMVIVAAPLYLLYEIAILLCSKSPESPEADA